MKNQMSFSRLILVAGLYLPCFFLDCDSLSNLSSLSQFSRDTAAKFLRKSFVFPTPSSWEALLKKITKGLPKEDLLKILAPYKTKAEMGACGGGSCSETYRLDKVFCLQVWYLTSDNTLMSGAKLIQQMQHVWVEPPPGFTGTWMTYFVNGQKSHEIQYKDGKYFGNFIAFSAQGNKLYVQKYTASGIEGEELGYFESGKVSYRAHHHKDKNVGLWIWYNEDGSVRSIKDYSKGESP